jgi:hypothetical protein
MDKTLLYYFSPLTVSLFGLVDLATTPNKMNCYTYGENEGKKGANYVASLLMQDLHSREWLRDDDPSPSLTIIFDNCGWKYKTQCCSQTASLPCRTGFVSRGDHLVLCPWAYTKCMRSAFQSAQASIPQTKCLHREASCPSLGLASQCHLHWNRQHKLLQV